MKNAPVQIPFPASGRAPYNAAEEKARNVLGSRIAAERKQAGLSLEAFSALLEGCGITASRSSISKWETGASIPSAYQLMAVAHALGLNDMFTRFTGEYRPELNDTGMRKLREYKKDLVATGLYAPVSEEEREYVEMPVSFLRTSAGPGQFLDSDLFEKESFPRSQVPAGAEFGIRISGDSMEPVFHDGQIAWVRPCSRLSVGEVGIFVYDGDGYIKIYNEQPAAPELAEQFTDSYGNTYPQPVMMSYNCRYAPIPVSPEAGFTIIGRVLS